MMMHNSNTRWGSHGGAGKTMQEKFHVKMLKVKAPQKTSSEVCYCSPQYLAQKLVCVLSQVLSFFFFDFISVCSLLFVLLLLFLLFISIHFFDDQPSTTKLLSCNKVIVLPHPPPPSSPSSSSSLPPPHTHTYILIKSFHIGIGSKKFKSHGGRTHQLLFLFFHFFSTMQQIIRVSMIVPPIAKKDSPLPNICEESPSSPLINSLAHVCFPSSLSQHLCCFFVVKNPEQM